MLVLAMQILVFPMTVSLTSTASGSDYPDHNLASDVLVFDGAVGDQKQDITFTLLADTYDEGLIMMHQLFETIIITFNGTNASNLQVDEDHTLLCSYCLYSEMMTLHHN